MMHLKKIRQSFNWSQQEVADSLEVDVSTISRWERGKTKQPLLTSVNRSRSRVWSYIMAMSDSSVVSMVVKDRGVSGLLFGDGLMIIALSNGAIERYPLLRAMKGSTISPLLKGCLTQLSESNKAKFRRLSRVIGSTVTCSFAGAGRLSIMPDGWRLKMQSTGGGLVYFKASVLTEKEGRNFNQARCAFRFPD